MDQQAMEAMSMFMSKHTSLEDAAKSDKQLKYVMGSDGVYVLRDTGVAVVTFKADSVPTTDTIKEGIVLKIPKIPYKLYLQTVAFFRQVMKDFSNAEAMVKIMWDEENKRHFIYVPKQTVGQASVEYHYDEELLAKYSIVADIHSHNTMGAHFSTTDDNDDKEPRISGVIGKLDEATPQYKFRVSLGKKHKELSLEDVFDIEPAVKFPKEWLKNVSKAPVASVPTIFSTSGYENNLNSKILCARNIVSNDDKTDLRPHLVKNATVYHNGKAIKIKDSGNHVTMVERPDITSKENMQTVTKPIRLPYGISPQVVDIISDTHTLDYHDTINRVYIKVAMTKGRNSKKAINMGAVGTKHMQKMLSQYHLMSFNNEKVTKVMLVNMLAYIAQSNNLQSVHMLEENNLDEMLNIPVWVLRDSRESVSAKDTTKILKALDNVKCIM
jgi:PRTRC genetic system protein A